MKIVSGGQRGVDQAALLAASIAVRSAGVPILRSDEPGGMPELSLLEKNTP
jgi:hypothetical protein